MGRPASIFLYAISAVLALIVVAAIMFAVTFDANDYKDGISDGVMDTTGRDLVIEGDISLSLFPWFAIEIGRTELGNAPGFDDTPFASFESARLSVKVLPMLLRREVVVGTAALDGLRINLQVNERGTGNWEDFGDVGEATAEPADTEVPASASAAIDVAGIEVVDAALTYTDAGTGDRFLLNEVNLVSGRVSAGEAVPLDGGLAFSLQPAGIAGRIDVGMTVNFDTDAASIAIRDLVVDGRLDGVAEVPATVRLEAPAIDLATQAQTADLGSIDLRVMSVELRADVEPFSYAGDPQPNATIDIAAFSPRTLMTELGIEPPETADPDALGKLRLEAAAGVSAKSISLSGLTLVLDDTTFTGRLSVPREANGFYELDLAGDNIDIARYMAPATEGDSAAGEESATVEIPVDLIRAFNARGNLQISRASLGDILFDNVTVGVNSADGLLRIHPIAADFFDGGYRGDIRIDASGNVPSISVNESISDVNLASMARAMFDVDNITGSVNGSFRLGGRGADMDAIRRDLDGRMSIELSDGAWEGTDVWYEMRRARSYFKGVPQPAAPETPRTQFSTMKASGVVTDGVLQNDDFFAELPFMQMSGRGSVNFVEATVDYSVTGRVLEKPEFMTDVSPEELEDFTAAVVPFRITGSLASPSIRPDVEAMLKERAEEEAKKLIMDKLFGEQEQPPGDGEAQPEEEEKDVEEQLKDEARKRLKDLFGD